MADKNQESSKPHLVMVPFPTQSHIYPMFRLAKLLHHHGFHITFLNTDFNHQRLLWSEGVSTLEGLIPNFDFASIPDGLPTQDGDAIQDPRDVVQAVRKTLMDPFKNFLCGLSSTNMPPVACIITDSFNSFAIQAAKQLSIPSVQFVLLGAGPFLPFISIHNLIDNGIVPLKDEECYTNGYLDTMINCLSGLEGITLKYLPSWILTTNENNPAIEQMKRMSDESLKGSSSAIVINTFEELEPEAVKHVSSLYCTKVFTVGPIHLAEEKTLDEKNYSFGANLWKQDTSCLEWLDSQLPGSVLLVSFGSIARLTTQQMVELAWGLANSKHHFLWVIRPDLVEDNGESKILPPEFELEIKERAFLTSWCPQEKVLKHPAIGGYFTRAGWNSLLESLTAGVPVLCWPYWSDQVINCWLLCYKWKMGMEMDDNSIKRDEVERLVKELMSGEKGQEMRKNAREWMKMAEEACSTGSSNMNFGQLVTLLRSL